MANVEQTPEYESIADLSIAAFSETREKLVGADDVVDVEALAKVVVKQQELSAVAELMETLPEASDELWFDSETETDREPSSLEVVTDRLESLLAEEGGLEDFVHEFTEAVFISGGAKPKGVQQETYDFLQEVGDKVIALREAATKDCAPASAKVAKSLVELRDEIREFTLREGMKNTDFVALNAQHEAIGTALKAEQQALVESVPKTLRAILEERGICKLSEVKNGGSFSPSHVKKLIDAKVIDVASIPKLGKVMSYPGAELTPEQYEAAIPPATREAIGEAIYNELRSKYSNKYKPIGTAASRGGPIEALDHVRLQKIAEKSEVTPSHVAHHFKYLKQHDLLREVNGGYELSDQGKHAGIGMRAIRFIQRAREVDGPTNGKVSLETYLEAARATRDSWQTPTYDMKTDDGGAPWTYLFDELYAGNARIDTEVLLGVMEDIKRNDEKALVIATNMLQGKPEVEPRAMRTSILPELTNGVDMRDYGNQIAFVKELLVSLGHPCLQLHGKAELETANHKTDVQRVRDAQARNHMERADEDRIVDAFSRINAITERAGRKYDAKNQAEILQFVSKVVMPLEMKLGRELMRAPDVRDACGLNMNELEIVRDITGFLLEDRLNGTDTARDKTKALYGPFLALEQTGPNYVKNLLAVVFPERENLQAGDVVARDGAKVQFKTPEGKDGLSVVPFPEARYGISEAMDPLGKLMGVLKSKTARGDEMPDIVTTGATGQSFFAMTAGGTAVVAADTFQQSDYDDTYYATESQDRHKRRRMIRGGENTSGSIAFKGGVHTDPETGERIKTDAYTVRLWNPKIQKVLDENAAKGVESTYVDIYSTSDWQTGSPTAKPVTWLRGMLWAIEQNQENILINGDVFQGMNYPREPVEAQLTGIIGIEDQQAFVTELMKPVLEAIRHKVETDPDYQIPKFTILTGNHETNSQANRGTQGIWFLQTLCNQIESFYQGAFGPEVAETHVMYPKKFVDRMGVDVDYSHVMFDFSDTVGFRIAAQHYVGSGAKGSKVSPPISAAAHWAKAMENEMRPVHGFLLGHWHTQSVTQSDGMFHCIFGANADKSGFEWHLGYPTTVPANGRVRLYSDRPPELFFVTDPYLKLQEKQLRENVPAMAKLVEEHGSLEEFIEAKRQLIVGRDQRTFNYTETKGAMDNFIDPHRKIG